MPNNHYYLAVSLILPGISKLMGLRPSLWLVSCVTWDMSFLSIVQSAGSVEYTDCFDVAVENVNHYNSGNSPTQLYSFKYSYLVKLSLIGSFWDKAS